MASSAFWLWKTGKPPNQNCMTIRRILRHALRHAGYDLHRLPAGCLTLRDLEFDLPRLVPGSPALVLDVGANKGQTIDLLRRSLHDPVIHCFEPNRLLAGTLQQRYANTNVKIMNMAVGSSVGEIDFNVAENDELSSVLELKRSTSNPFSETKVSSRTRVPITTIDKYCAENNLGQVGLLKSDTQGYDLEVLKGAASLLGAGKVGAILVEVNFVSLYDKQCDFGQIERWLAGFGYRIVTFYEIVRNGFTMSWATACFAKEATKS
jgi:FkbM family methyltransferase